MTTRRHPQRGESEGGCAPVTPFFSPQMALLPNLSTLSLVDTEAREEDVFELDEEVDTGDPFALHHDAWTGPPARRRSLGARRKDAEPYPRVHPLPDDDEPNATIPDNYNGNEQYFEDERRKDLKWGFLFRQQKYPFDRQGERNSTDLLERVQLKERFERKDGLQTTCRRKTYRGRDAEVFRMTTLTATYKLQKAIEDWHSLCYVVNGRDDVLGVMALGQRVRHRDPFTGIVTHENHQMKLPSEWINGMRTLIRKKGIHRQLSARTAGQGNYTPSERYAELQDRHLDFYIEWVCTAGDEHVLNLPPNLAVRGVGRTLLDGLVEFVREVYVKPCARAMLVEQWSLPDLEMWPGADYDSMQPVSDARLEAQSTNQGLAMAVAAIEYWVFFDFIALNSAKDAWKKMGFCQAGGLFLPWNQALDSGNFYEGVDMYLPMVGFDAAYRCPDGYVPPPPPPQQA